MTRAARLSCPKLYECPKIHMAPMIRSLRGCTAEEAIESICSTCAERPAPRKLSAAAGA